MGIYKLSSQFTDFVSARSSNPERILTQVGDAIELLGELNVPLPGDAAVISAFHESPSLNDEFMMSHLQGDEREKAEILNSMYEVLGNLQRTGKIGTIAANTIEKFLQEFSPVKLPEPEEKSPAVIRGRRGPKQETPEVPELDNRNRFTAPEDQMISRLDRKAVKFLTLLSLGGVLERVPEFNERQKRLSTRKFEWVKVALDEFKEEKIDRIKDSIREVAKKMRVLENLRDNGKMSEEEHLVNFEHLAQQASMLHAQMDKLEEEKIPTYDLSLQADIRYLRNSLPPKMG